MPSGQLVTGVFTVPLCQTACDFEEECIGFDFNHRKKQCRLTVIPNVRVDAVLEMVDHWAWEEKCSSVARGGGKLFGTVSCRGGGGELMVATTGGKLLRG